VKRFTAGLRRELGRPARQKAPVTEAELKAMLATLPPTLVGIRDRAILLVGFVGAFRRSELVALDVESVANDPAGATISLERSETHQESTGFAKAMPFGATPESSPCGCSARVSRRHGSRAGRSSARSIGRDTSAPGGPMGSPWPGS